MYGQTRQRKAGIVQWTHKIYRPNYINIHYSIQGWQSESAIWKLFKLYQVLLIIQYAALANQKYVYFRPANFFLIHGIYFGEKDRFRICRIRIHNARNPQRFRNPESADIFFGRLPSLIPLIIFLSLEKVRMCQYPPIFNISILLGH